MSFVRLKTDINGGFPLVLDDIRVLQGELNTGLMNYLENICPTDGAVWIRGGLFPSSFSLGISGGIAYVSALGGLVNIATNNLAGWNGTTTFLRPAASTFDSAGLKTFQNGTTADTYELPRYTINTGTAGAGDIVLNDWVYLNQDFDDQIVTFASGITNGNIVTLTPRAKYVSLICSQINGPAGTRNTDEDLFTINNTLFDSAQECIGLAVDGNGAYNIPISINTSGVVTARFGSVNGEYPLAFVLTYPLK
jgi:hypothetical protein